MAKDKATRKALTQKQMTAAMKTFVMLADANAPVDCAALLQFIEAAQSLYTQHCPIAMRQAKKVPVKK